MKKLMSLVVAVLFVAGAAGCKKKKEEAATGSATAPATTTPAGSAPAPAASGTQACDLIDEAKLGELAGKAFKKGQSTGSGTTSQCGWSPADEKDSGGGVSITYYSGSTGKEAWKNMAALGGDPAPGVGDEASVSATDIRVRKGDNVALISFNFAGGTKDQLIAVGKEVATKM